MADVRRGEDEGMGRRSEIHVEVSDVSVEVT